jgi:hypothetical protein
MGDSRGFSGDLVGDEHKKKKNDSAKLFAAKNANNRVPFIYNAFFYFSKM